MAVDIHEFARLQAAWQRFGRGDELAGSAAARDPRTWVARLAAMQLVQSDIAGRGAWTHGHSSLMPVLGIARREVANCRVVRWLLDPLARHGIGASMVAALGAAIGVDLTDPQRARAEAEVGRSRSRADVVVTGAASSWTVVIEAKIGAGEGPEQGYRLEQDWLEEDDASQNTTLVFLTLGGVRLPVTARDTDRWVPLAWRWFVDEAERLLAVTPAPMNDRGVEARHAVEEWLAGARRSLR